MSQATNVDLAYRFGDALNAREVPQGLLAPDFVMVNASTAVTDKTYHGAAGVLEWTGDLFEAFDPHARFEIKRVVAEGDDFVVTTVRLSGTGARSGMQLDFRWAAVFWCCSGKLARVVGYLTRREALDAVGLSE
jgi:ketosteroid isomerase-like protein